MTVKHTGTVKHTHTVAVKHTVKHTPWQWNTHAGHTLKHIVCSVYLILNIAWRKTSFSCRSTENCDSQSVSVVWVCVSVVSVCVCVCVSVSVSQCVPSCVCVLRVSFQAISVPNSTASVARQSQWRLTFWQWPAEENCYGTKPCQYPTRALWLLALCSVSTHFRIRGRQQLTTWEAWFATNRTFAHSIGEWAVKICVSTTFY